MATSERSNKRPSRSPVSPRPRRKAAPVAAEQIATAEVPERNVGSLEGALSLALGVLLVVAALFPRSIKQLLMLGIGGGMLHRGLTGQCSIYKSLGVDTTKDSLLS